MILRESRSVRVVFVPSSGRRSVIVRSVRGVGAAGAEARYASWRYVIGVASLLPRPIQVRYIGMGQALKLTKPSEG